MPRTRSVFRALALLAALTALAARGGAQPLPGPKFTPVPVLVTLLPYVGDENVQKELKLDADQTKKLLAHRQKTWDEAWNTAPKDADVEGRFKATEAEFKAVLTADQLKRANQLATQILWNGPRGFGGGFGPGGGPIGFTLPAPDPRRVPSYVLQQYQPIADALKLDETQKTLAQALRGPGGGGRPGAVVYLTPDQSATAKDLLGAPYTGTLRAQFDTRDGGFGGFGFRGFGLFGGMPERLQYTAAPDVQKELKLKEDQLRALADLRLKWTAPGTGFEDFPNLSPAARKKVRDERAAEAEKAIDKILTAEQRKRLAQIERQADGPGGPEAAFFEGGALGKDLGVTDAQRKRAAEADAALGEAVAKAVLSGEPVEKVRVAGEAARKDHDKALDALLTPDQQAKRKELFGEPFAGQVYAGGGFGGPNPLVQKFSFGRYANQLPTLLRYRGVQDELKLTEDQLKKLDAATAEMRTRFPPQEMAQALQDEEKGDRLYAERSAYVEKVLADVLTKEQQARFRELNLQQLEAPAGPGGSGPGGGFGPGFAFRTAASYPGVAEAIKLTAEQKKRLIDDGRPADVLTDEQKKQIAGMLGKPAKLAEVFGAAPGFPGGFGPGNAQPALSPAHQLLLDTAAWDELKLDHDQVAKLVPAANTYSLTAGARRGPGGGFGQPIDPKGVRAAVEAFGTAADGIVTADQRKRLDQLAVQQTLAGGLDPGLLQARLPEAARALALTDDQRKKVSELGAEAAELSGLVMRTDIPWPKQMEIRNKLRERLDAGVRKELTADQRAKVKELTGAPWAGATRPFVGGPGGFPGGGGFGGPFGP
jgi:hypothetical protein